MDHEVLELVREDVPVGVAREVAGFGPRPRDRVDHPVDHLLDAPLAYRASELASEVLGGDHVRRRLRPELGDLDAFLLEDVPGVAWDDRIAMLPFDVVIGVNALASETTLETKALRLCRVLDRLLRYLGDRHVRAPLKSRDVRCAAERPEKKEKEPLALLGSGRPTGHLLDPPSCFFLSYHYILVTVRTPAQHLAAAQEGNVARRTNDVKG